MNKTTPSKIIRPTAIDAYPRECLFTRLDVTRSPATCLTAPAGSGKTTLISSYIEARSLPCIWYRVDDGDNDIAALFHYMALAARMATPGAAPLPALTPEYAYGLPTFTRRWFESLFAGIGTGFVLVFDDCHEVEADSPFNDLIRVGIETMPPGLRIFLASRNMPPPTLSRALANKKLDLLDWDDLRLDDDEARGIIRLRGTNPDEEEVKRLCDAAGGWAAGITLLLEKSTGRILDGTPESDPTVFAYFAEEILKGFDPPDRDFLMRTAFMNEMTPETAALVSGNRSAAEILARLRADNCFIERHQGTAWRYHPLFRQFLLERARNSYPQKQLADIRDRAAKILEQTGKPGPAAALYIEGADWRSLATLVITQAGTMIAQGRYRTVDEWLKTLPADTVAASPWLLYWRGVCALAADPVASRASFERSFELFSADKDREGILSAWSGAVETYLHSLTDLAQLDRWISFLDRLDGGPFFAPDAADDRLAARMFAALAVRQPRHPRMPGWKKRALAVMDRCTDLSLRMLTGFYLHTFLIWTGNYPEAQYILERLREISAAAAAAPLAAVTARVAESWAWLSGDSGATAAAMKDGLAIAAESGVHIWDYLFMVQGVAAALSSLDTTTAGELLAGMARIEEKGRDLDRFYYHYQSSWRFHLLGDFPRALMHQEKAMNLADDTGLHYARAQGHLAMAHLRHEEGDQAAAAELLETAARIGTGMGSREIDFVAGLFRAHFSLAKGREKTGLEELGQAMALGRKMGYRNFSWWHPGLVTSLCARALEADIETGYVRELIRTRRQALAQPPPHAAGWEWPVKINVLGPFRIFRDGEPLRFQGKAPRKPLQLLRVLIALGGVDVDEERLQDILWPDADGDAGHKSLEVTLARLRKLLGRRDAIVYHDGRVSVNGQCCYIDILAFTTLSALADTAGRASRQSRLRQAVDLYQGHFLADEAESWVISRREDLRDQFVRRVGELGHLLREDGRHEEAAEVYRKGLRADDLVEEFHQGLITCHTAIGRRDRALAAYDRCCSILAARGLEPSPRTIKARDRALRS